MSRRVDITQNDQVESLKREIDELKRVSASLGPHEQDKTAEVAFSKLSPVEQSAASLGVHPEAWKPISFMNDKHYEQLVKSNALDDTLARRIEAYRVVASDGN